MSAVSATGVNRYAGRWPMSDADLPRPWRIVEGRNAVSQVLVDGAAWLFRLERDGAERALVVVVSGRALALASAGRELSRAGARAIQTDGRSEAARVAQFDDLAECVMLGGDGYLPAPAALARPARPRDGAETEPGGCRAPASQV